MRAEPTRDAERRLVASLCAAAGVMAREGSGRRYDSEYALVLDLGIWCRPAPFPTELAPHRGPERACYQNAARLAAATSGLCYVEGYADAGLASGALLAEHAWTVDIVTGTVVDPTWEHRHDAAYLGVVIPIWYRTHLLRVRATRIRSDAVIDSHADPSLQDHGLVLAANSGR